MAHAPLRIIDPCAPRPYCSLADMGGLGGTESTVLHIASALSDRGTILLEQAARTTQQSINHMAFLPMDLSRQTAGTIVVINSWQVALICRKRNPRARILVWQHVFPDNHGRAMIPDLLSGRIEVLCVSRSLATDIRQLAGPDSLSISVIANPVADDLHPDMTPRDRDLLFFASSPHKGLDQVFTAFETLRARFPGLRLELADPGYLVCDNGPPPQGVIPLGTLSHADVIARMRCALCIFYPQTRFAETFGLVIAEANAVGCPVLVHQGLGANDEVVSDKSQCIDGNDPDMIAARIGQWRETAPCVSLRPRFRLAAVLRAWRRLLRPPQMAPADFSNALSHVG